MPAPSAALTETPAEMPPPRSKRPSTPRLKRPLRPRPKRPASNPLRELEAVGAGAAVPAPQSTEKTAQTDATERAG